MRYKLRAVAAAHVLLLALLASAPAHVQATPARRSRTTTGGPLLRVPGRVHTMAQGRPVVTELHELPTSATAAAESPATPRPSRPTRVRTAAPARATPAAVAGPHVTAGGPADATFDRLAGCESGGRWALASGNGYYGGLQFSAATWHAYGGNGLPSQHSRAEQIDVARRVQQAAGWAQWPSCSRQLGLR